MPAWLAVKLGRRCNRSPALLLPFAWVAVEAVLPNIFPTYVALFWAWQPRWIQVADVGGVTTVTFAMLAINACIFATLDTAVRQRRVNHRAVVTLAATVAAVLGYGTLRLRQIDAAIAEVDHVRFGVVQGNMSIRQMMSRDYRPTILAEHQRESARLQSEGAQIVVWGETAYPNSRAFSRDRKSDLPQSDPWRVRRSFDVPVSLWVGHRPRGSLSVEQRASDR